MPDLSGAVYNCAESNTPRRGVIDPKGNSSYDPLTIKLNGARCANVLSQT